MTDDPADSARGRQRSGWVRDRVTLAIGGASGIGRGVVHEFLAEGARVAVLDRDRGAVEQLMGEEPDVLGITGDATNHGVAADAVDATVERWGRLDVLLCFAGVFDWYRRLEDMTADEVASGFDELFAVNVKSALFAVHAATQELRRSRGNIVLTLSTSSFYPGRGGSLYVASKFALRGLVLQLGHELAPEIRVNGVAPGGTVATNLSGLQALDTADRRLGDQPDRASDIASRTPLEVAMTPEDHAAVYVLLASDRARGLSGVIVNSDGGMAVKG